MQNMKAMITGVAGLTLTSDEQSFIRQHNPWAFVLFARNIKTAEQVKELTAALKQAAGRDVLIFVDQEGGLVQRLRPPLAPNYPPAETLGALYKKDAGQGRRIAWVMSRLHAFDLRHLGLNADCMPVLDVPVEGAHKVIGSRAYGRDVQAVTDMGKEAAQGLIDGGVLPVMKHIPGHGRAQSDTHLNLAHVDASLEQLERQDFATFRAVSHLPAAMTAHVIYDALDHDKPATLSKTVIQKVIRGLIGFDGLLMTDDISMKALSGDLATLTQQTFSAGCDVVLHCNGKMQEMVSIVEQTPILDGKSLERAVKAEQYNNCVSNGDETALRQEFSELLALS